MYQHALFNPFNANWMSFSVNYNIEAYVISDHSKIQRNVCCNMERNIFGCSTYIHQFFFYLNAYSTKKMCICVWISCANEHTHTHSLKINFFLYFPHMRESVLVLNFCFHIYVLKEYTSKEYCTAKIDQRACEYVNICYKNLCCRPGVEWPLK